MLTSIHTSTIAAGTVPDWIHLVPSGTFSGNDGRGPYTLRNAAAVVTASMRGGKVPIDENHSTDILAPLGLPSPAIGWIVEMEARTDGIWGRVEWTPTGRKLVEEKAYRGVSPAFEHADGTILKIARTALTNVPNLPQLATLHANQSTFGAIHVSTTDQNVCARMGIDPQVLAAFRSQRDQAGSAHGLAETDLTICQAMNLDPARMAALRNARTETHSRPYGFPAAPPSVLREPAVKPSSSVYEGVTKELVDPNDKEKVGGFLREMAHPRSGSGQSGSDQSGGGVKLTKDEVAMCDRAGVDPREFVEFKLNGRYGRGDPLFTALPEAAQNACQHAKRDPSDYARQWWGNPIPGTGLSIRI